MIESRALEGLPLENVIERVQSEQHSKFTRVLEGTVQLAVDAAIETGKIGGFLAGSTVRGVIKTTKAGVSGLTGGSLAA